MDREELTALSRSRVEDVKLGLDFASNFVKEVQRDIQELPSSDGDFAIQRALRLEDHARAEYLRVQRILTDLMTEGKIPDEDDWQRRKAAGAE